MLFIRPKFYAYGLSPLKIRHCKLSSVFARLATGNKQQIEPVLRSWPGTKLVYASENMSTTAAFLVLQRMLNVIALLKFPKKNGLFAGAFPKKKETETTAKRFLLSIVRQTTQVIESTRLNFLATAVTHV